MAPATNANAGTNASAAKPCAITPPILLQPATQPVARPRSLMMGKLSAAYGIRIEMTALVPTIKRETETSGLENNDKARVLRSSVASNPSVVTPSICLKPDTACV